MLLSSTIKTVHYPICLIFNLYQTQEFDMDDDLRKSLLTGKGTSFQKLYEECLVKIQRIKQKNDFLQRQVGEDIEQSIRDEVKRQKQFLENQIDQLKDIMNEVESRFKDPESKNKLKTIKSDAQKQIQRNKIIMKDLIVKSFLRRSQGNQEDQDQGRYMEGGTIHHENFGAEEGKNKNSVITDRSNDYQFQAQDQTDLEMERKMLSEKKQLLDQVQQTTLRVNAVVTDMAIEVDDQGKNLDIISEELLKAHKNVEDVNQTMEQASKLQKKSRRKYMCLVVLIILLVGLVLGLVFILKK